MSQKRQGQQRRVVALATVLIRSLNGGGLKAPPRHDWEESLIAWVGVFCTMLALTSFNLPNDPLSAYEAGWFSSTLCIVFSLTAAPVGQPIQMVLSHIWNCLVGLAFRFTPLPMRVKQSMSTAFGVSGMAILGIMHPPSTALAYTFASRSDTNLLSLAWVLICGEFCGMKEQR
jgi:CBS-domain-containing membrane protein